MMAGMRSVNVLRVALRAQRTQLPSSTRLLSSSSQLASTSSGQKPPSPQDNAEPPSTGAQDKQPTSSGPSEQGEGGPVSLPSLDFDPASEPKPASAPASGRTGAKSSKGSLSSLEKKKKNMLRMMFAGATIGAIAGTVYMGREWEEGENNPMKDAQYSNGLEAWFGRFKARFGNVTDTFNKPAWDELLPKPQHKPYTLLLSIDDLLVTSTWDRQNGWRTAKRPGVDYFIAYLSQFYEVVIFTTQQQYTAEPIINKLDPYTTFVAWRLYREATRSISGKIVKDLSYLNRDLSKVILIDTDPDHVSLQPENSILLPKWKGDPSDTGLVGLIPFLESIGILQPADVRPILKACEGKDIARLHAQREAEMKRKALEDWNQSRQGKKHTPSSHGVGGLKFSSLLGGSSHGPQFDPSQPPPTYLEIKRKEAQEYYLKEQQWIKENEESFKRQAEEDQRRAMEMGGTLMGMLTGAGPAANPTGGEKSQEVKEDAAKKA